MYREQPRKHKVVFNKTMQMMKGPEHRQALFDEMMNKTKVNFDCEDEDLVFERECRESLWMLFLEAIQKYPRMQKLKDVIDRAAVFQNTFEQEQKRVALENYLLMKQLEDRKRKDTLGKMGRNATKRKIVTSNENTLGTLITVSDGSPTMKRK